MKKGKPSKTARKVALNVLTLGAKSGMEDVLPAGLIESTADLLVASGAAPERVVRCHRSTRMLAIYDAFEWMMPGQFEAFGYRKAFCEQQVRAAIDEGATQVLVLGAGYDTLCWRLAPEYPKVSFFEIDEPATAELKASGIAQMGNRENLHLIAEDLGKKELPAVLDKQAAWSMTEPTVIVAEGLLMYLTPSAVEQLLANCAEVTGAGSRIAFSYVGTRPDGRHDAGPCTGLVLWLLKAAGEPWQWSINPQELDAFLSRLGWAIKEESREHHGVEYFAAAVSGDAGTCDGDKE